jgi:hypothetical protein
MRRIQIIGALTVLTAGIFVQIGCDKEKKSDRSVARTERPGERQDRVTDRIEVPDKPRKEIDKTDLTPMGYLAIVVRSRERGKLTKSLMNLRSIGQAVEMYRAAEGRYPPSFQALARAGYISSSAGRSAGNREYDIVYLAPASQKPNSTNILAFDPVCYPVDAYAILFIDGTTATMSLEDIKYQLQQQGVK